MHRSIFLAAALPLGLLGLAATAGPAVALPSGCTSSASMVTCTYTGAGTYSFTVPDGVNSLDVTAVGAAGGSAFGPAGGPGGSVEDVAVTVSAGQVLPVIVGGAGAAAWAAAETAAPASGSAA